MVVLLLLLIIMLDSTAASSGNIYMEEGWQQKRSLSYITCLPPCVALNQNMSYSILSSMSARILHYTAAVSNEHIGSLSLRHAPVRTVSVVGTPHVSYIYIYMCTLGLVVARADVNSTATGLLLLSERNISSDYTADCNYCPQEAATTHLASHEKGGVFKYGLIAPRGCRRQQRTSILSPGVEYVGDLCRVASCFLILDRPREYITCTHTSWARRTSIECTGGGDEDTG